MEHGQGLGELSQSAYVAIDYKHFQQTINTTPTAATNTEAGTIVTPITYYPLTVGYNAFWKGLSDKNSTTDLNLGVTVNFRGLGSGPAVFDLNRFGADGSFIYLRGTADHTYNLSDGFQIYGRIQGRVSNQPLVSSEEYSGGGEQSVRGYLESEEVGDDGAFATLELRSPPLTALLGKNLRDWRTTCSATLANCRCLIRFPARRRIDLTERRLREPSGNRRGSRLSGAFDADIR